MSDVVTGEAVVLELRLAKLPSRAVAFGIDLVVMVLGFLILTASTAGLLTAADTALAAAVFLMLVVGVFVGYPVTLETLTRGRSLGKIALGLRVVREDAGPIRFRHALTRGLTGFLVDFGVLSLFTGAVGLITSLVSPHGRRVGDMLAGTVVVRDRAPAALEFAPAMPRALAGWATGLELSGLPDSVALSVRQFLRRTPELDPQVRESLARTLATQVADHANPAPPEGTPPEAYLAAVLAERRRREQERLAPPSPGGRPTSENREASRQNDGFAPPS